MSRVAIVSDSVADIPPRIANDMGISIVPAYVQFGLETFRDGVDITPEEFYARLSSGSELPKSSQPSPGDFYEAYAGAIRNGATSIISIQPTSDLTGTYASACMAREYLKETEINIVDTRTASMAQGLIALEAARAVRMGLPGSCVLEMVNSLVGRVRLYVCLDTLDYIVRSGRVGRARAFVASLLNIKPIITLAGTVEPVDRVRGMNKVIPRLVELCQDGIKSARVRASVIHAQAQGYALRLKEQMDKVFNTECIVSKAGPGVVTNAGPGAFGVAVLELPEDHPVPD